MTYAPHHELTLKHAGVLGKLIGKVAPAATQAMETALPTAKKMVNRGVDTVGQKARSWVSNQAKTQARKMDQRVPGSGQAARNVGRQATQAMRGAQSAGVKKVHELMDVGAQKVREKLPQAAADISARYDAPLDALLQRGFDYAATTAVPAVQRTVERTRAAGRGAARAADKARAAANAPPRQATMRPPPPTPSTPPPRPDVSPAAAAGSSTFLRDASKSMGQKADDVYQQAQQATARGEKFVADEQTQRLLRIGEQRAQQAKQAPAASQAPQAQSVPPPAADTIPSQTVPPPPPGPAEQYWDELGQDLSGWMNEQYQNALLRNMAQQNPQAMAQAAAQASGRGYINPRGPLEGRSWLAPALIGGGTLGTGALAYGLSQQE